VGDFLFLSGIGPRKPGTGEIPDCCPTAARHRSADACLHREREDHLEEAGSSLEKVLDVSVYLTDMQGDFERFNAVYGEYFGKIPADAHDGGRGLAADADLGRAEGDRAA
jgi:2-aminomuconate deaminase